MLRRVDDRQRAAERLARLQARNERRRARGEPAWQPADGLYPGTPVPSPAPEDGAVAPAVPVALAQRRLAVSSAIFGVATGLSRVLGLVREMVASYYFGASGRINAFTVAFQVPNLVRAFVADAALSSAFVPVFSDLLERGERRRAWRVASSLFWLMLLGLTALTALFILVAPWVIGLFGNPGHHRSLAVGLSRVLFPIVALLGISGIVVGILNSYDHFTVPALSPVFWNVAIVAGLAIGVPHASSANAKLYVYAGAILGATFIQVFLPMPWLRGLDRGEERLRIVLDWRDPAVRKVFKLMVPVTLGLGLININARDRLLLREPVHQRRSRADCDPEGVPRLHAPARDVLGRDRHGALPEAVAPRVARRPARHRRDRLARAPPDHVPARAGRRDQRRARRADHPDPLPARPAGTRIKRPVVAGALAAFSAGLVFNGAMLMLNRAFFSLQSNWVPTIVALGNLFLNAILDALFYRFGTWGIPLGTAVCNIVSAAVLVVLLRRRLGRIDGSRIASSVGRIAVASALVAGAAWIVWHPLDSALGRSFPAQVVSLGAALLACALTYFVACRALRVREMQALLSLRSRLLGG